MTWTETRRRQDVIREVRAKAEVLGDGSLPWSDDYTDVFAGPEELLAELEYRWRLHIETQIDTILPETEIEERWSALHERHHAVLGILQARRTRELAAA